MKRKTNKRGRSTGWAVMRERESEQLWAHGLSISRKLLIGFMCEAICSTAASLSTINKLLKADREGEGGREGGGNTTNSKLLTGSRRHSDETPRTMATVHVEDTDVVFRLCVLLFVPF